jgi:urease accessory protein
MAGLILIRQATHDHAHPGDLEHVRLPATRATLTKRRWRGAAEDGQEFGFDLEEALGHGTQFYAAESKAYVLEQTPEEVLEIPVTTVEQAARVAWSLGNLHFGVQVLGDAVRVTEDPAVLQLLAREHITFRRVTCIFLPLSASAHHHHDHGQHHHG